MGKKKTILIIGGVALAVAAVAGVAAYLANKNKSLSGTEVGQCVPGAVWKNPILFGTGTSSIAIDRSGMIGTITFDAGYVFDLHVGAVPTMQLPACFNPVQNTSKIIPDDAYTTIGVKNASEGVYWVLRYYRSVNGEPTTLKLVYSPPNADGTRFDSRAWSPVAEGTLKLTKPVVLAFNLSPLPVQ